MKYQPKVNDTQQYSDGQGKHIVHKGELILLKGGLDKPNRLTIKGEFYNPIIISETEEIKEGDMYYNTTDNTIHKATKSFIPEEYSSQREDCYKVLALPEHFSDKHLQTIVDGKMEDGKVLVKCTRGDIEREEYFEVDITLNWKVCLNQQNHITLFPAKQSLEDKIEDLSNKFMDKYANKMFEPATFKPLMKNTLKEFAEWAKKNHMYI